MSAAPTILVVDDDAFIRRPLELILRAEGFDALTAVDGDDCMERLECVEPDLIILDVMMPGRDGFEVCRLLKQDPKRSSIPIILLSARGRPNDRDHGLALGAADYVTKPYSPTDLVRKVRKLIESSTAWTKGGQGE